MHFQKGLKAAESYISQLQSSFVNRWIYRVTVDSAKSYSPTSTNSAELASSTRLIIAALGIERYRHKHSKLPARLADLVPEFLEAVPRDPLADTEVSYRLMDGEFSLWSVGLNGKDDAGADDDVTWDSW
jgi:hypothetical protein